MLIERIAAVDHAVFRALNRAGHTTLDGPAALLDPEWSVAALAGALALGVVLATRNQRGLATATLLWVAMGAAWLVGGGVIKNIVQRSRPEAALQSINRLPRTPARSDFSFPSSHAATAFAAASLVALRSRQWALRAALLLAAAVMALSRVYLGFHFPVDVLVGSGVGCAVGWGVARAASRIEYRRASAKQPPSPAGSSGSPGGPV